MLYRPRPWTNQMVQLYHGTTGENADAIMDEGVSVVHGRVENDFGRGFYTTTLERQAQYWADQVSERRSSNSAPVIQFGVDREELAELDTLAFVRGDFAADDFWSFVAHCREGNPDHGRARHPGGLYDVVIGPVASFWQQRSLMEGADQISFHTGAAERVLNMCERSITWKLDR